MLEINIHNFKTEVLEAEGSVLLDFWAPWCGPCRMFGPILEQYAARHPEVKVGKVNVDEEGTLAMEHRISNIPSLVLYRNGKIEKTAVGVKPLAALEAWVR